MISSLKVISSIISVNALNIYYSCRNNNNKGYKQVCLSPLDCQKIRLIIPKVNQLWIVIERTDAEAEAPILWPPDDRADSLKKTPMLGKTEGRRRKGWQRMRWLDSITDSMHTYLSKLWVVVEDNGTWRATVRGVAMSWTLLSNRPTITLV